MNIRFVSLLAAVRAPLVALFSCCALLLAPLAWAQSNPVETPEGEPTAEQVSWPSMDPPVPSLATTPTGLSELLIKDSAYVLSAPVRWDGEDWRRAAWISGAVLGTGLLLDRPIQDATQRHGGSGLGRFARHFEPLGTGVASALALAGFYAYGTLADDERAIEVARDGFVASVIASGLITPTLKFVVGRSRPNAELGTGHFQPFKSSGASFPSGHSTQAFAMATVIASHYDEVGWVPYAAYGVASLVGLSRIHQNAHFASDVLAGAAIGVFVGKTVVAFNSRRPDGRGYSIMPLVSARGAGFLLQARF